jgi:hypothetical protein
MTVVWKTPFALNKLFFWSCLKLNFFMLDHIYRKTTIFMTLNKYIIEIYFMVYLPNDSNSVL